MSRIPKSYAPMSGSGAAKVQFHDGSEEVTIENVGDVVSHFNKRLYFLEEALDLFLSDEITKRRFIELRRLYRSGGENRKMAITIVEKLHTKLKM